MAHHIRVKQVPHTNVDGSKSKTKKDYLIYDRTRGRHVEIARVSSKAKIEPEIENYKTNVLGWRKSDV